MSAPAAETGLFLDGLHCAGCVGRVERALAALDGVLEASVNHTQHRALVRYDDQRLHVEDLVAAVDGLGYRAVPFDPEALARPATREARNALVRVLVAAFLAANVMMVSLALYIGAYEGMDPVTRRGLRWLAVALSLPASTWCAAPFWRGAWLGLRRREISIDVPIALGIGTAFVASILGTLAESPHVFADSAAMIVFLILIGRTLERGARARASDAVARLAALAPERARRLGADGVSWEDVEARLLAVGERIRVAPGEAFPCDARLLSGATEVDESLVSGESSPVLREAGECVGAASRNVLCEVVATVEAPAGQGTLARLAALLERAQTERPRVQRLADRVARVFAPAVLAVAGATAVGWALAGASLLDVTLTFAAVLIVACPCALALATPAAVTAAIGRAASLGILFKSGEALERCAGVDAAVLDKTGTVSEGRLAVDALVPAPGVTEDDLLAAAAAAEGAARHPAAEAIARAAERRGLAPAEMSPRRTLAGRGVLAGEGAERVLVGSRALLDGESVTCAPELLESAAKLAARGASLAFVARGPAALGVIALLDPLRPDAPEAIARLRALGVEPVLVSGDHERAVARAAERAGILEQHAGVSPDEKVAFVRARREQGACVLAVGDGINDAAALAAADVGIAMARGADVAVHAADVVVRAPRLGALADAVALSRSALRRIRENLGFAVAYNAVAVPLAVAGLLDPLHAAAAMSLSSLVVTGNALRLVRWRAGA